MTTFSGDPIVNRPRGVTDTNLFLNQESFLEEAFRGTYSGANLIMAGFAKPGSHEGELVWQISKFTYDGDNLISITWPVNDKGVCSNDYEFSWTTALASGYTFI